MEGTEQDTRRLKRGPGSADQKAMRLRTALVRLAGIALLALWLWPDSAWAQIYHWVDDDGRTHYTDNLHDVPPRLRREAEDIQEDLRKELLALEPAAGQPGQAQGTAAHPAPPPPGAGEVPELDAEALAELERMMEEEGFGKMLAAAGAGMLAAFGVGMLLALLVMIAFSALMLILACRIVRTEPPSFAKGMTISAAQLVANIAVSVLAVLLLGVQSAGATTFQGASFGWSFLVYAGVLHGLHGTSFGSSLLVAIVATLLTVAVGFGLVLVVVCAGGFAAVAG